MRAPDFDRDGWSLDDGEQRHAAAPDRFEIPPLWVREALEPGDFAQLIFKIAIDDEEDPTSFERMWVVVTGRTQDGYVGVLNNEPASTSENDALWLGSELPFWPRHIIDVAEANDASMAIANAPPKIAWAP